MKYFVISDNQKTVDAFNAMGVEGVLASEDNVASALEKALGEGNIGTVLLAKTLHEKVSQRVSDHRREGVFPVIMEI